MEENTEALVLSQGRENKDEELYLINEFKSLLGEAGFSSKHMFIQNLKEVDPKTYFGKGKIEEVANFCRSFNASCEPSERISYIACNFDLSALQKKNIEKIIGLDVIDRTNVILNIFEKNAKTKEAILQVEIAKLNYLKNHLINEKASYSQVTSGGGKHNKGEGEKQLELNRRVIRKSIMVKSKELESIKMARRNSRNKRKNSPIFKIGIVGYTNVGKSTLVNSLLEYCKKNENKSVLSRDSLFATLETSTRLIDGFRYPSFLVTDTVGFCSDLPICLIDAFRSTLEEITESDLLIHVVDVSSPFKQLQIDTTNQILKEIGVDNIPLIYFYNKYDLLINPLPTLPKENELYISLKDGNDMEQILDFIYKSLFKEPAIDVVFPYEGNFKEFLSDNYVLRYEEKENGYKCSVKMNPKTIFKYNYLLK